MEIPVKQQEFCKAVARLCREYGLHSFQGEFRPGFRDPWHETVKFHWSNGRHGDSAREISIESTTRIRAEIENPGEMPNEACAGGIEGCKGGPTCTSDHK